MEKYRYEIRFTYKDGNINGRFHHHVGHKLVHMTNFQCTTIESIRKYYKERFENDPAIETAVIVRQPIGEWEAVE